MARSRLSILSNATRADVRLDPYPYLVVEQALDQPIYEQLARENPDPAIVMDGRPQQDTWYDYPACKVARDSRISPLWREFFAYHTSRDFFLDVLDLFGAELRELHPGLERRVGGALAQARTGVRQAGAEDNRENYSVDLSMECQFYVNYTRAARAVRGPHVDRPTELYAGLLYFRLPEDTSSGSDLEVCRARMPKALFPGRDRVRVTHLPMEIDDDAVEVVETARYAPNKLVLFLGSAKSIHAVSPRTPTPVARRHINFCADVFNAPLFELAMPLDKRVKRWISDKPVVWRLAKLIAD